MFSYSVTLEYILQTTINLILTRLFRTKSPSKTNKERMNLVYYIRYESNGYRMSPNPMGTNATCEGFIWSELRLTFNVNDSDRF